MSRTLLLVLAAFLLCGSAPAQNLSDAEIDALVKCLIREARCTPAQRRLQRALPSMISNGCARCSQQEQNALFNAVLYLYTNRPRELNRLRRLYDPNGTIANRVASQLG